MPKKKTDTTTTTSSSSSSKTTPLKYKTELREFLSDDLKLLIASFKAYKQKKQVLLRIVAASGVRRGEKNIQDEIKGIYLSKSKKGKYTLEDACAKVLDCVSEENNEWIHQAASKKDSEGHSVVRERFTEIFGLDTRSLAVARMALGLLVILDVWIRVQDYNTFYTERGILSRRKVLELNYHRPEFVSLFMACGASWWAGFCFFIEVVAGACFMVGYRTRFSGTIAWFMVIGSHARFSMVLNAGDILYRVLLFWSLFLPMGARMSIDRRLKKQQDEEVSQRVYGVATIALLFQVLAVYIFTVLMKTGPEWRNGTAVYYALRLDYFAKQPFANFILSHEWMWRGLTHATLFAETYGPIMVFFPFFFGFVRTYPSVPSNYHYMKLTFSTNAQVPLL